MSSITGRLPAVIVEYDRKNGTRGRRTFADAYEARRFYARMRDRNPAIICNRPCVPTR